MQEGGAGWGVWARAWRGGGSDETLHHHHCPPSSIPRAPPRRPATQAHRPPPRCPPPPSPPRAQRSGGWHRARHIRPYGLTDLQSSVLISLFIQHLAMTTNQECGEAVRVELCADWCRRLRGHAQPPAATNQRVAAARGVLEVFKLHHCPRLQGYEQVRWAARGQHRTGHQEGHWRPLTSWHAAGALLPALRRPGRAQVSRKVLTIVV